MSEVWIKEQPKGMWFMRGDRDGQIFGGWDEIAELRGEGDVLHWEGDALEGFIEEFGPAPTVL